jgi:hypothetical protein
MESASLILSIQMGGRAEIQQVTTTLSARILFVLSNSTIIYKGLLRVGHDSACL